MWRRAPRKREHRRYVRQADTAKRCFDIEVTRDDRWWMIHVPEIDRLTQARHRGEIEEMALEYIAVDTGIPIGDVAVWIVGGVPRRCKPPL
jgi:hypothetical protein